MLTPPYQVSFPSVASTTTFYQMSMSSPPAPLYYGLPFGSFGHKLGPLLHIPYSTQLPAHCLDSKIFIPFLPSSIGSLLFPQRTAVRGCMPFILVLYPYSVIQPLLLSYCLVLNGAYTQPLVPLAQRAGHELNSKDSAIYNPVRSLCRVALYTRFSGFHHFLS